MKKINFMLLMAATLMFTTTSCNDNDEQKENAPVAVSFTGQAMTRVTDNKWDANDEIGVSMLSTNGLVLSDGNEGFYSNYLYTTTSTGATAEFTATIPDCLYYPADGTKVKFAAYYPHEPNLTGEKSDEYEIEINTTTPDVMFCITSPYSINNAVDDVELPFQYQLAKIRIAITAGTLEEGDLTDATLTITGAVTKATMNVITGEITLNEDTDDIELTYVGKDEESDKYYYETLFIPQGLKEMMVLTVEVDGEENTYTIPTTEIEANTYKYSLRVNKQSVESVEKASIIARGEENDQPLTNNSDEEEDTEPADGE